MLYRVVSANALNLVVTLALALMTAIHLGCSDASQAPMVLEGGAVGVLDLLAEI